MAALCGTANRSNNRPHRAIDRALKSNELLGPNKHSTMMTVCSTLELSPSSFVFLLRTVDTLLCCRSNFLQQVWIPRTFSGKQPSAEYRTNRTYSITFGGILGSGPDADCTNSSEESLCSHVEAQGWRITKVLA
jgi:hypothetical protein